MLKHVAPHGGSRASVTLSFKQERLVLDTCADLYYLQLVSSPVHLNKQENGKMHLNLTFALRGWLFSSVSKILPPGSCLGGSERRH